MKKPAKNLKKKKSDDSDEQKDADHDPLGRGGDEEDGDGDSDAFGLEGLSSLLDEDSRGGGPSKKPATRQALTSFSLTSI